MTREEALAILELPQAQAEAALLGLWEKAEQWERLQQAQGVSEQAHVTPTTPSGMTPVYLKPQHVAGANARAARPGMPAPGAVHLRGSMPSASTD